jgi:hypothetical protein
MANGDVLYKKNIRKPNIETLADIAYQFEPALYKENKPDATEDFLGFLVAEVAAIDPRLVEYNADGDPDTVRHTNIVPLLVAACRSLKARVDDLESRVTALESP